jgi:hypothetical protein
VLVVTGGNTVPAVLTVVDGSDHPVATYTAGPAPIHSRTIAMEDGLRFAIREEGR